MIDKHLSELDSIYCWSWVQRSVCYWTSAVVKIDQRTVVRQCCTTKKVSILVYTNCSIMGNINFASNTFRSKRCAIWNNFPLIVHYSFKLFSRYYSSVLYSIQSVNKGVYYIYNMFSCNQSPGYQYLRGRLLLMNPNLDECSNRWYHQSDAMCVPVELWPSTEADSTLSVQR